MKVARGQQLTALIADPSQVTAVLLHGPDQGFIRHCASQMARTVLGQDGGMFRLVTLPREDHGRLRDELATLPLGGGRRVIRVQDGGDGLASPLGTIGDRARDILLIVEAGSLTARSKLRSLAERSRDWAVVSCFPEPASVISREIKDGLDRAGLAVTPDALAFLTNELEGDFARRQAELEKLIVFAAGEEAVDLACVTACCAGQVDVSLGQAVNAALAGEAELTDRLLDNLAHEGATGPGLLAVLALELHRILKVRVLMEQGQTAEEACRSMVPPLYPRQMAGFMAQLRRWPLARSKRLGEAVRLADQSCKRAGSRDFAIAARLLASVAQHQT